MPFTFIPGDPLFPSGPAGPDGPLEPLKDKVSSSFEKVTRNVEALTNRFVPIKHAVLLVSKMKNRTLASTIKNQTRVSKTKTWTLMSKPKKKKRKLVFKIRNRKTSGQNPNITL